MNVYCPSNSWCNIDCLFYESCYLMHMYIENQLTDFFNLDCSSSELQACTYADITCQDTTATTDLAYDLIAGVWNCDTYGCCPYTAGNANVTQCSSPVLPCTVCLYYVSFFCLLYTSPSPRDRG